MKGPASFFKRLPELLAVLGACAGVAVACSGGKHLPPGISGSGGSAGGTQQTGPCTDGQTRDCHVNLGQHNGVLSCYEGTQTCVAGTWGACGDGTVTNLPAPGGDGGAPRSGQALSSPTPCQNDPCDPYCQNFNEQPDAGVVSDATAPKYSWSGGTLTSYPGGLVNKGLKQPCSTGADCQFNEYCQHPITSSACAHSKCETGAGLDSTCDSPCVTDICATDPSCCDQPHTTTCAHDPCTTGTALTSTCDACVATVCSSDAYCCTNAWDSLCRMEANSKCGGCPLMDKGNWTQSCVDDVNTVCDAKCGTGSPLPEDGTCVPWMPGQTDSTCSGVDLSAGVPCDTSIPVCNHGTKTAPAGVLVVTYPANSNQYPKCDPSGKANTTSCTTTQPIPPGECVNVTGCLPKNTNDREIMVNPPDSTLGTSAHISECSCQDNWTLYKKGSTCGLPSCTGPDSSRVYEPVDMYFIVDKSGSMWGAKWNGLTTALSGFFTSSSSNIGAALEFFPLASGGSYGDGCGYNCSATPCSNPMVPLTTLPSTTLSNAFSLTWPGGNTPTYPALDGALTWAKNAQATNPNANYMVLLVTDGDATVCDTKTADLAALADSAYLNNSIRTYTIGMDGANISALDQIAQSGGTGKAYVISGTTNVAQQLTSTLQAIASQNSSCVFNLPSAGTFDPKDVTVTFTSSGGVASTLPQVPGSGSCGSGWYYDNNTSPTTITLCPQTCSAAGADAGSKVTLQVGCPKLYSSATYTQIYQATCPTGTLPQWGYLAYDTTTPSDSNVQFSARTAPDQTSLSSASYTGLATAQASPDTQVCPMSGPSPCPVDLYSKLGQYDALYQYLELEITLNPSSDQLSNPTVNNWQITYSCPPAQ